MRIIDLATKAKFDHRQFVKRSALDSDYDTLITEDTLFWHNGEPTLLYCTLDFDFTVLRAALCATRFDTSERTGGLKTTSRVFGYQPRIALRRDYCTATSLAYESPETNALMCDLGARINQIYAKWFPNTYHRHFEMSNTVLPEWKFKDAVFTSGIINRNNPLKYHFDAGNFDDVCSCMVGLRQDVEGGYLCLPAHGIALKIDDRSLTIFNGQSILHGVTPLKNIGPNPYRYTIVYYALKDMWKCEPMSAEVARIRNLKSQRERKRIRDTHVIDQNGNLLEMNNETDPAGDTEPKPS